MIRAERLLKVLCRPQVSEKVTLVMERNNTYVFKVMKNATKAEIKDAVSNLFLVKVKKINTLLVKGKATRHGKRIGRRSDWKKAYITLEEGHTLNLSCSTE